MTDTYDGPRQFLIRDGVHVEIRFSPVPPDRHAGILGWTSENHALYDPATGQRMEVYEANMTDEDWESIAETVDLAFDFDGWRHRGRTA